MSSMLVAFDKYLKILPETPKCFNSQSAHIDFYETDKRQSWSAKTSGFADDLSQTICYIFLSTVCIEEDVFNGI